VLHFIVGWVEDDGETEIRKKLLAGENDGAVGDQIYYWGMSHLCSKKGHKNSDRMTTFLQDRMVKKNLFFRLFNVDLEV
jgi:hypothetical protein